MRLLPQKKPAIEYSVHFLQKSPRIYDTSCKGDLRITNPPKKPALKYVRTYIHMHKHKAAASAAAAAAAKMHNSMHTYIHTNIKTNIHTYLLRQRRQQQQQQQCQRVVWWGRCALNLQHICQKGTKYATKSLMKQTHKRNRTNDGYLAIWWGRCALNVQHACQKGTSYEEKRLTKQTYMKENKQKYRRLVRPVCPDCATRTSKRKIICEEEIYDTDILTEWSRCIGCVKLQVSFRKRAHTFRAFWRKMMYKDKASYDATPPCKRNHTKYRLVRSVCPEFATHVSKRDLNMWLRENRCNRHKK